MRRIPVIITEDEFLKLYKRVYKNHHKIAFALGFYACMRVSEVVKLQQEDIDRGRKTIHIKQSKGGKDRIIPIPPKVLGGLKYIPVNVSARALQIAFRRFGKKILNKELKFHSLRHSGATHYHDVKKWDIRYIQQFLGHSRLGTTEIYTHVHPDILIEKMWENEKE